MLVLENNNIRFIFSHCQQCGFCENVCPTRAILMHQRNDGLSDIIIEQDKCIRCQKCIKVCPSVNSELSKEYLSSLFNKKYYLGYNQDELIRRESSSGGVCETLIIEGLESGYVDGVYSLKKCEEYPQAKSEFYTSQNIPSYFDIPNSVYHSVMMGRHFKKVGKCNRLMIVGTPCQLKVMEKMLKDKYQELIKVCIFCKQQKTLNSTRFLAKVMKTKVPVNLLFTVCYRGKGWPGIVNVDGAQLSWNKAAQLPFGRRLWTVPGCNICGDPFGMEANADITLMDPWIIRGANDLGETLITVHTEKGLSLLQRVPNLTLMPQKYNDIEPALGLTDIRRKRELVPYFRGEACTRRIRWAGRMEQLQRKYLQTVVGGLPSLPFIFYRVMCKLPDWRNIILK